MHSHGAVKGATPDRSFPGSLYTLGFKRIPVPAQLGQLVRAGGIPL
jgi:hypothetical protein